MDGKRSLYSNKFDFFVNGFMASVGISFSVYAILLVGETTMTHSLPLFVLVGLGVSLLFAILAIYNYVMMLRIPKDTRPDDLVSGVKQLSEHSKIDELGNSKPKINIDFKMDTADIAKMNDGQRKSTGIFIDKLQGKDTKKT